MMWRREPCVIGKKLRAGKARGKACGLRSDRRFPSKEQWTLLRLTEEGVRKQWWGGIVRSDKVYWIWIIFHPISKFESCVVTSQIPGFPSETKEVIEDSVLDRVPIQSSLSRLLSSNPARQCFYCSLADSNPPRLKGERLFIPRQALWQLCEDNEVTGQKIKSEARSKQFSKFREKSRLFFYQPGR